MPSFVQSGRIAWTFSIVISVPRNARCVPENGITLGPVTIYYRVEDLDGAVAALEARGLAFDHGPHLIHRAETTELWMANLQDPDGNPVVLMEDKPSAAR